ncbi:MAG: hypothetical protein H6709_09260 [Kofleriaceae bacterium]|nr:hypothetical protein [Myxococcales bacterium]MCB9561542.1 hypothetical protein [Kofleriaceae bacterium]MCB9572259.1 hypothetical protein [Kofleriaceae bacterium]
MAELDGSILVVHPDRKAQRALQRVLAATLRTVVVLDLIDDARLALRDGTPSLIVMASRVRATDAGELMLEHARVQGCADVVIVHDDPAVTGEEVFGFAGLEHLVTSTMPVQAEELAVTAAKLLRRDLFGLEKYLGWGAIVRDTDVRSTSDRQRVIDDLAQGLEDMCLGRRHQASALLAADELIFNAIYNAPIDDDGRHYLREVSRADERPLVGRERPRVRWGCDGRYLAIEVTDRFGSLDAATVVRYVAKCTRRVGNVRAEGAGAGIGMAMAYAATRQLVYDIEPGRRTEAIALIDVRPWPPGAAGALPSLHLFIAGA